MAKDLLLEVGLEEVPAKYVRTSSQQLKERVETFLNENGLSYASAQALATPRRLSVIVKDVAEKQEDSVIIAKGPSKQIALNESGEWSKAAIGFVMGQGLSVDDIYFETIKDVEYVHVKKEQKGLPAQEVLVGLKDVILQMTFPISMTWGEHQLKYIRPIHWLVALYGQDVIPFEILGVKTGAISRGHRFLGETTTITSADDYVEKLEREQVIVDQDARKDLIVKQIESLATANNWDVAIDEELLEEVTSIVEYPTAFFGKFDEKYLVVPDEVLITTMKEHQRYFYVKDKFGKLLPFFIAVRNGNDKHLEQVVKGNEKVLVARLEDALFFTKEDAKIELLAAVDKLKTVNYHVKIGTLYEKMMRVRQIVAQLGKLLQVDVTDALRASEIYKFDLVTNMVGEFPELQGIMGEKYAIEKGESKQVAQAIREHYLPLSSDGDLPESIAGAVLAVADKADALISFFLQGMIPSGSNDPYALRRQAIGIVNIFESFGWAIAIDTVFAKLLETVYNQQSDELENALYEFVSARVAQRLATSGYKYDVIQAVTNVSMLSIPLIVKRAEELHVASQTAEYKEVIEASSRILRLKNSQAVKEMQVSTAYDVQLAQTESEKEFARVVSELKSPLTYVDLTRLKPVIAAFFEDNMVLVDDEKIKTNRVALVLDCANHIENYADTLQLMVK